MAKVRAAPNSSTAVGEDTWRIPDALWERIEPLLPPRPPHPLGCHNPRVPDRKAMDAIFFVLRTGCHWNALNATGICSSSAAHRRFQEWTSAGVFVTLWAQGLQEYDELKGLDWEWSAMDGAMTKAPLGGERTGKNPTDRGKRGRSGACWSRPTVCRSGWPSRGPTVMTRRWRRRRWRASRWTARSRQRSVARDVLGQGLRLRRHAGARTRIPVHGEM